VTAATARAAGTGGARRPRSRLTPGAVLLMVCVLVLLFVLSVPLRSYLSQRGQLDRLQLQAHVLEQQDGSLEKRVQQLHDPLYLQRLARECLGMVEPGEIRFSVTGKAAPKDTRGAPAATGPADC